MNRASLGSSQRILIKVGSRLLADSPTGLPGILADQICSPAMAHRQFGIVSSGAIALGGVALGWNARPTELSQLQAAAAIGQNTLIKHWGHAFAAYGRTIAQVLLTHEDLSTPGRAQNAKGAMNTLLNAGVIPIVNENDTVATEEITYGDNDKLAALLCAPLSIDLLILLTDVDGVMQDGAPIAHLTEKTSQTLHTWQSMGPGSGGMRSKIDSALLAAKAGCPALIANGTTPRCISSLLAGDDLGTLVTA